jgi:hypothetical protein
MLTSLISLPLPNLTWPNQNYLNLILLGYHQTTSVGTLLLQGVLGQGKKVDTVSILPFGTLTIWTLTFWISTKKRRAPSHPCKWNEVENRDKIRQKSIFPPLQVTATETEVFRISWFVFAGWIGKEIFPVELGVRIGGRKFGVARFSLVQYTKMGKLYQTTTKFTFTMHIQIN